LISHGVSSCLRSATAAGLLLLGLAGGCSSTPSGKASGTIDEQFTIKVRSSGWRVVVSINGQPVLDTVQSGFSWDVTTFVIDGVNTVRVSAEQLSDPTSGGSCAMALERTSPKDGMPIGTPLLMFEKPDGQKGQKMEEQGTIRASVPVRWRWQDGDDTSALNPDDGKAIFAVISAAAEDYRRRDWNALRALRGNAWSGNRTPEQVLGADFLAARDGGLALMKAVGEYPDFTVIVTPPETLRMLSGSRVVVVWVDEGRGIIYAGHSPEFASKGAADPPAPSLRETRMRFFKKDGQWYWY
jgi:hypothetical protein